MQSQVRETGEHIRLVEASIVMSRGRTNRHRIKVHQFRKQFMCSRIRQQGKVGSIKGAARVPITIMIMREMVTQRGPMRVTRHCGRISPGQCILGWEAESYKRATSVMRWTIC